MRRKYYAAILFIVISILFAMPVYAEGGNWSEPGVWCGDPGDLKSAAIAARFRASAEDMMMGIPVYDVRVDYAPKGIGMIPIMINREDISVGRPSSIIWIGRYNGYNEEKISLFADNERVVSVRFTGARSASGDKFYALEGIVTWTPGTKRPQDKICVVWDSTARVRVYLGISFPDLLRSAQIICPADGYIYNDSHDYIYDREINKP